MTIGWKGNVTERREEDNAISRVREPENKDEE
jgi:hypothetical protein